MIAAFLSCIFETRIRFGAAPLLLLVNEPLLTSKAYVAAG